VEEDYGLDVDVSVPFGGPVPTLVENSMRIDGRRWGWAASVGASVKFDRITFEPFIKGGYQKIDLSGNSEWEILGFNILDFDMDRNRDEWFIGAGFYILFDL